jgi:hypothetical protein
VPAVSIERRTADNTAVVLIDYAATGRKHLVIAGLMTDGCVMHAVLSALRAGYRDVACVP